MVILSVGFCNQNYDLNTDRLKKKKKKRRSGACVCLCVCGLVNEYVRLLPLKESRGGSNEKKQAYHNILRTGVCPVL